MWRQYCPLYTWCKGSTERLSETSLQLRLLMWLEHIRWQCCPQQSSPHAQLQHKPSPLQQWPPPLPEANSGHDAAPAWRNPRKCQSCGTGTERGTVLIAQLEPNIRSCKHSIESSLCQHVLGIDSPHLWNYDIILWWYTYSYYSLYTWGLMPWSDLIYQRGHLSQCQCLTALVSKSKSSETSDVGQT